MLFDQWGHEDDNEYNDDDSDDQDSGLRRSSVMEEEDDPIFRVIQLEWQPTAEQREVVAMATGSDVVLVGCYNNAVVWIKTYFSEDIGSSPRCEVERADVIPIAQRTGNESINKVFMDPSGNHAIIGMKSGQNYYIHSRKKKLVLMTKIKNVVIESVAWNTRAGTEYSTKNILIGTSNGLIFETMIEDREKSFKKVHDLNTGTDKGAGPICGLQIEVFPGSDDDKYLVVAATPNRIYEFIGGPTFEAMFNRYDKQIFQELPGSLGYSELRFHTPYQQEDASSDSFAMLTYPGIYHGNVVFSSQNDPGDLVLQNKTLTPYSKEDAGESPLSICLTQFHFLLLKRTQLVALNRINEEIIFEYLFDQSQDGVLKGLAPDARKDKIWMYSSKYVFQVLKIREDRDIWRLHLDNGEFQEALKLCKSREQREQVLSCQADYYFKKGMFELAAVYYAKTNRSFEEVALKFVNYREPISGAEEKDEDDYNVANPITAGMPAVARNALKTFLRKKLESLRSDQKTQQAMICTWLTEIFLDNLNRLQRDAPNAEDELQGEQQEFRDFLWGWADRLNRNTTFELISSHGRVEDLLYYAEIQNELEWMLTHHIQNKNYAEVLKILSSQQHPNKIPELFRKFCPTLMATLPKETVNMLIEIDTLDPVKLLPALMRYEAAKHDGRENHAIRYLQHVIFKGNNNPAVHNYMISLLVKLPLDQELNNFIKEQKKPIYDYKYALRLCHQQGKKRACVGIYTAMGLYQEAVKLALEIDVKLAKRVIKGDNDNNDLEMELDEEERKKLWLMIAKHVIENGNDISKAMSILKECDEILRLEDILPYFDNFVKIGDFKDEIIKSLEEYNTMIENLKNQMEQFTQSADLIRQDMQDVRNRSGFVSSSQRCDICSQPVLSRQFLLFPCTHVFHFTCVTEYIDRFFASHPVMKQEAVEVLANEPNVDGMQNQNKKIQTQDLTDKVSNDEFLKNYATLNCVYCGEIMIEQVQEPFIALPNEREELDSWAV